MIFTEDDLAIYLPGKAISTVDLNVLLFKIYNFLSGKLNKKTLDVYRYTQEISTNSKLIRVTQRPLVAVEFLKSCSPITNKFELVDPAKYEIDLDFHEISLSDDLLRDNKYRIAYTSGWDENSDPVILHTLKTVISHLINYMESPEYEGIKKESIIGEILLEYGTSAEADMTLNRILEPIMEWKAIYI